MGREMNILRSAWELISSHRMAAMRTFVVMVRAPLLSRFAERNRRRAIADLESLPRAILRDLGIRREEIPIVVARAARAQTDGDGVAPHDGGPGSYDMEQPSPGDATSSESAAEPASRSKVA